MEVSTFRYSATCSATSCPEPPTFKIAAPWSHGPIRELKGYGLACELHLPALLARAEGHRQALAMRDDEVVGPVEVFPIQPTRPPSGP